MKVLLNATSCRDIADKIVGVIVMGQDITERKKAVKMKMEPAKELQQFINNSDSAIFGIDACGLVNEWNDKLTEITGFSKQEVLGRNFVQFCVSPPHQASADRVLQSALNGVGTASVEFPLFATSQRHIDMLLSATTRRDLNGRVVGVIGIGQDITERKQAEEWKTRVAQELQAFMDTANAPIFGIDASGLINEWNNKAAAITKFSREEVLGRHFVQIYISDEHQASVQRVFDNSLEGKEAANFEFPLFTKDHRRVEILLNATPRRDVTGKIVGVIGFGQDITERKQVEEEKTRVAQELQTFIDTANAPIFGIDANGLVNEWNNKSAAITGFSRLEVLGKDLVQVGKAYLASFMLGV